ncbi:hypothetical protein PTTW11_03974 [Pyrenophora teres f. teres]|uniref:Uncharacterized protein n=1 Tax=Pyrenophora teres f. teres TaxID=97479 RepID=A0A6S6VY26_9PLEO|nr:hypothetical protein HRS9122_00822 [Pyrenophora teres f. teres]CAE7025822.1 hypothetical protein PTTW11_03974 [Pyrenophora teres f. teres]
MLPSLAPILLLLHSALAAPVENAAAAAATVGKIRGVRDPIYHLYLQASSKNASTPVLGPESTADEFTIGGTIQSKKTSKYLNIGTASTSYKPLVWGATGQTTAWGLEGDTIITVQGSSYGRREAELFGLRIDGCSWVLRFVPADGKRYAEWEVV